MNLVKELLVTTPNCRLSLVLASVVQGDAVNCNSVFPKKFSKLITFLLIMRKGFEAEQPFLLIFCSTKFVLFNSVCLLANFCFCVPVNLLFVNTAKLLLESRHASFSFAFASCDATDLETSI